VTHVESRGWQEGVREALELFDLISKAVPPSGMERVRLW